MFAEDSTELRLKFFEHSVESGVGRVDSVDCAFMVFADVYARIQEIYVGVLFDDFLHDFFCLVSLRLLFSPLFQVEIAGLAYQGLQKDQRNVRVAAGQFLDETLQTVFNLFC